MGIKLRVIFVKMKVLRKWGMDGINYEKENNKITLQS
jgi:hypothetical protein